MSSDGRSSCIDTRVYAGADWVRATTKRPMSPLGEKVADLLGWLFHGIYHIQSAASRVDWSNEKFIEIVLPVRGGWSTYDNSTVTRLVIAAHDLAVRVGIEPASPRYLRLRFLEYPRGCGRGFWSHPTIDQAIAAARQERA